MGKHHSCSKATFMRSLIKGKVDSHLCTQIKDKMAYWKNVLKRVVAVIKKLSSRGLALRGHDEKFGSVHNGNFMMCLELLAEFDPFIATHMAFHRNPGKGHVSYLSFTICDEFIELLGSRVLQEIVKEVKESKYFSIIVDSTPDISHIDELSFIIWYVQKDGVPVEKFVGFLPNVGHKFEQLVEAIISFLKLHDLDIKNCVGQSYDNEQSRNCP